MLRRISGGHGIRKSLEFGTYSSCFLLKLSKQGTNTTVIGQSCRGFVGILMWKQKAISSKFLMIGLLTTLGYSMRLTPNIMVFSALNR